MSMAAPPLDTRAAREVRLAPPYPVRYDAPPAEHRRRLSIAFRIVLALPHILSLYVVYALVLPLSVVAWLILLFSGTYEPGLAALPRLSVRWYARLTAYLCLLRDEYPPWSDKPYPLELDLPLQVRQGRWSVAFRLLLALPHYVALSVLGFVRLAAVILAWFALLFTGHHPEGPRRLVVGINRWEIRALAYVLLLRGDYPPFSLGLDETAPEAAAVDVGPPAAVAPAVSLTPPSAPAAPEQLEPATWIAPTPADASLLPAPWLRLTNHPVEPDAAATDRSIASAPSPVSGARVYPRPSARLAGTPNAAAPPPRTSASVEADALALDHSRAEPPEAESPPAGDTAAPGFFARPRRPDRDS